MPGLRALTLHVSALRWCRRPVRQPVASGGVGVCRRRCDGILKLTVRSQGTRWAKRPVTFALPAADARYVEHLTRNFTSPSDSRSQNTTRRNVLNHRANHVDSHPVDTAFQALALCPGSSSSFISGTVQSATALAFSRLRESKVRGETRVVCGLQECRTLAPVRARFVGWVNFLAARAMRWPVCNFAVQNERVIAGDPSETV